MNTCTVCNTSHQSQHDLDKHNLGEFHRANVAEVKVATLRLALRELVNRAVVDAEKFQPEGNEPIWAYIENASDALRATREDK